MGRDVAVGAAERRWIIPPLARSSAAQAAVADTIRVGSGTRIEIPSRHGERESRAHRDHAARLPPAQNSLQQALGVTEYRQVVDIVEHHVMRHVKAVSL